MKKSLKNIIMAATGAVLTLQSASAVVGAITYSDRDLLLDFYKQGGTTDYQVDLGSVNQVTSLFGSGSTIDLSSKFSLADINAALGSLNSANFGVLGVQSSLGGGYAANTLWITQPRTDFNTQTSATGLRSSGTSQGNQKTAIATLGGGLSSLNSTVANPTTAAVVPKADARSYEAVMGSNGDINGLRTSSIEITTPGDFTAGSQSVRLDLYELLPSNGTQQPGTAGVPTAGTTGTYLGFFEFSNTGALTFTAVPEASTYASAFAGGLMLLALARVHRKSVV